MRRLGDLITQSATELATVQVRENGKLIREVADQAKALANHCYFFAGVAESPIGETLATSVPNMQAFTMREPIGVVALITPWNSPLMLLMAKLAPAAGGRMHGSGQAVGGDTGFDVGVRTADQGSGLPRRCGQRGDRGWRDWSRLGGSPQRGQDLVHRFDLGRQADRGHCGHSAGPCVAGAGGKSPNIVFPDADLDNAVNGVMAGIFAATGQTCMAGSRVLVHDDIYDDFAKALATRASQIRLGDPSDPASEMGTVACRAQYDKVLRYIDIAKAEGAVLAAGGKRPDDPALEKGLFVEPTVFTEVTNDMRIAREEVFGPVASLIRFRDEDDAVRIANDTSFGLAAGVWTRDIALAHRMIKRLRAGTVWINNYRKVNYVAPFGGFKESGIGRENGMHAVNEYTEVKSAWIDTGNTIKDPFNPRA